MRKFSRDCCRIGFCFGGSSGNGPAPTSPTPPPTPPTTTTTTTLKPYAHRDRMIDESFLIWPESSEDTFTSITDGSDELITSKLDSSVEKGTFIFREGLCGEKFTISIESNYSGKFWRHKNGKIKLDTKENTDDFQQDSCFKVVRDQCGEGFFALQSVKDSDKVIQSCGTNIELRKRSEVCGEEKAMCWANPVSQQANLAYCATSVTSESDINDHPECCAHEATVEEYGSCCLKLLNGNENGCNTTPIPIHQLAYCPYRVRHIDDISRFPQCCMHPYILYRIRGARQYCCTTGYRKYLPSSVCPRKTRAAPRKKRENAACNFSCWSINYCPWKMRNVPNWTEVKGLRDCCCHPFRNTMLRNGHANNNNEECGVIGYPTLG